MLLISMDCGSCYSGPACDCIQLAPSCSVCNAITLECRKQSNQYCVMCSQIGNLNNNALANMTSSIFDV